MRSINIFFRNADALTVGDEVLVHENDQLLPERIADISSFTMQGKYYIFWNALIQNKKGLIILKTVRKVNSSPNYFKDIDGIYFGNCHELWNIIETLNFYFTMWCILYFRSLFCSDSRW